MRAHTQEFKEQIKELGKQIDSRITYGDTIITSEELYSITPVANTSLLKSVMKELDFESSVSIPLYSNIKYEFGLLVNGDYEYIDYGNYIVHSCEYNEDTKSYNYVCYDAMLFSMKTYTELKSLTILQKEFPMTIRDYIMCLCTDIGLTFKNRTETFANYNQILDSDLYANLNYTYRDIFDELSQVTASNICINGNNQVEIRYLNDTGDTIDEEYLKDINVKFGEKYGPINSIVLSRSAESDNVYLQDESSIESNGLCEIKIIDNQIMNFNNRSDYLPDILEKLNGLEYYLNDYSSTGILYYELCDKYNIKIGENTYNCILFNDEQKITQGLIENIYTEKPEESVTDYTKADKTDRKINQVYAILDKQNKKFEVLVSEVNENTEKISSLELSTDNIKANVEELNNDFDFTLTTRKNAKGFNNINIQDAGNYNVVEFGIDGNSYQETSTQGKNLFDTPEDISRTINGLTFVVNEDGSVTITGTSTDKTQFFVDLKYPLILDGTYTFSLKTVGTISTNQNQQWLLRDADSNNLSLQPTVKTDETKPSTTTLTNTATKLEIFTVAGTTFDCTVYPQLELNTAYTEWEQFVPNMPSPNYPSEIEVVEGYNLINKEEYEQGYCFINSIKTANANWGIFWIKCTKDKTYTISGLKAYSGTDIVQTDKDKNILSRLVYRNVNTEYTFTTTDDGYIGIPFVWNESASLGSELDTIQLIKGTVAKPYVPYRNIGIRNIAKNLLNLKSGTYTSNGISATVQNGVITLNGTATATSFIIIPLLNETILTNYIDYMLSANNTDVVGDATNYCSIRLNNDGNYQTTLNNATATYRFNRNIDYSLTYITIRTASSIVYNNFVIKPQLELGAIATNYEKYKEQIAIVDLKGNFVGKVGDIKDRLYIKDGHAYLKKYIGKVILDGSHTLTFPTQTFETVTRFVFSNVINSIRNTQCLSDYFTWYENQSSNTGFSLVDGEAIHIRDNPTEIGIKINKSIASSSEELISWLSKNPVAVYYILATPETIDLGEVSFKTFEGVNNISLLASMNTDIDLIYLTDSPLNGEYATKSELIIESDKITSEVNKKVSVDDFETVVEELDSKMKQTADSITSSVSATYSTKDETTQAKNDAISSANASTDSKLKNYSTTTEMNSVIQQTADSINSVVSTKIGENEVVSSINQSAEQITLKSNRLVVESDNFKLDKTGNITAIGGTIGGYTLSNNNLSVLIKPDYDYTSDDLQTILDYYLGKITLTDEEKTRLDYNKDGAIDLFDSTAIQNLLDNGITKSTPGQFLINANDGYYNIAILDGNGQVKTKIGLSGITTNNLSSPEITDLYDRITALENKIN